MWTMKVSCDSAPLWLCAEVQLRCLTNTCAHSQTFEELQLVINVYLLLLALCVQGKWGAVCCCWVWTGRPVGWVQHIPVCWGLTALVATRQLSVRPTLLPLSSSFSSLIYLYCPPFLPLNKATIFILFTNSLSKTKNFHKAFITSFSSWNILLPHSLTSICSLSVFCNLYSSILYPL